LNHPKPAELLAPSLSLPAPAPAGWFSRVRPFFAEIIDLACQSPKAYTVSLFSTEWLSGGMLMLFVVFPGNAFHPWIKRKASYPAITGPSSVAMAA
jgi:hypothetical protein